MNKGGVSSKIFGLPKTLYKNIVSQYTDTTGNKRHRTPILNAGIVNSNILIGFKCIVGEVLDTV